MVVKVLGKILNSLISNKSNLWQNKVYFHGLLIQTYLENVNVA